MTNNATATFAAGVINNGADLELSSSQYFSIADASQSGLDITGSFTFAGWIKFETTPPSSGVTQMFFISKWADGPGGISPYEFGLANDSGTLMFQTSISDGSNYSNIYNNWTPSTGTWYHVACTWNSTNGTLKHYVNGSQQGTDQTTTGVSSLVDGSLAFRLGANGFYTPAGTTTKFFDGMMDEWGVWTRVLTGPELTSLYNGGAGLSYPFSSGGATLAAKRTLLGVGI